MSRYEQPDDPPITEYLIRSGKHRGRKIGDLDRGTLHAIWASWNGLSSEDSRYIVSLRIRQYLNQQKSAERPRKSPTNRRQRRAAIAARETTATHYRWTDPLGIEHWIQNDVDMSGRETEACPFDTDDSLDNEFKEIVRP